jgi:hypothetical protein
MGATLGREAIIADSQFGGGSSTWAPATWYLALSTTTPSNDGSNFTEPSGGSYARVSITNNATNFPAAVNDNGVTKKISGAKFTFPNPTGAWGTVTHFGFFTASSGGTVQYWQALDASIAPKSGNTPVEFDIGQLVMIVD